MEVRSEHGWCLVQDADDGGAHFQAAMNCVDDGTYQAMVVSPLSSAGSTRRISRYSTPAGRHDVFSLMACNGPATRSSTGASSENQPAPTPGAAR